jgi:hypothetical protein
LLGSLFLTTKRLDAPVPLPVRMQQRATPSLADHRRFDAAQHCLRPGAPSERVQGGVRDGVNASHQSPALSCSSDQPDQYQQDHGADNGVDDCGKDPAANQDSKLL